MSTSPLTSLLSLCIDIRLIRLIPGLPAKVARTFFGALVSSAASVLLLFCVSTFVAGMIEGRTPVSMLPVLFGMILMLLIRITGEVYRERSAHATAGLMKECLRSRIYRKILELGPSYTDTNDSGTIAATFVDGTEQLEQYVAYYIPYILLCLIVPAGLFLGFAFLVDLRTALILIAFVPLVPLIILLSNQGSRLKRRDVWQEYRGLSAYYAESLQGLPTLKLFNQQQNRAKEIRIRADRLSTTWIRRLRIGLLVSFFADMVPYLGYGSALLYTCIQMNAGMMQTGQVMLVLLLGPIFYEHIIHLGQYYHNSVNAKSTINAVIQLIETEPAITEPDHVPRILLPLPHVLAFRQVSFAYDPERPVLADCSFSIGEGEVVAIVGSSGVGKSTVIDLLFRFYDPDAGIIEVCGMPARSLPLAFLRSQFSLVSQDTYLFCDTILNNLRFGKPDASEKEITYAVRTALLEKFIQGLPEGYQTIAGERGLRLSGGERQRIAIGRALLKDAPILLLDEPTSSVDAESERYLRKALSDLLGGRTVLIIAHRLSTIRKADRILVMDNGRIRESGTHEELLSLNGRYAELVRSQNMAGFSGAGRQGEFI